MPDKFTKMVDDIARMNTHKCILMIITIIVTATIIMACSGLLQSSDVVYADEPTEVTAEVTGWKHVFPELDYIGLSIGQEFGFLPEIELNGTLKAGKSLYISVYAGGDASGELLTEKRFSIRSDLEAWKHYLDSDQEMFIRSIPADSKALTFVAQIGGGSQVSGVIDFSDNIKESETLDLEYMDIPGDKSDQDIGGIAGFQDSSPSILDAVSLLRVAMR